VVATRTVWQLQPCSRDRWNLQQRPDSEGRSSTIIVGSTVTAPASVAVVVPPVLLWSAPPQADCAKRDGGSHGAERKQMRRTTHLCGPLKSAPTSPACHCSARFDRGTGFVIATRLRATAPPPEGPARRAPARLRHRCRGWAGHDVDTVRGESVGDGLARRQVVRQRLGRSTCDGRDHPRHLQPRPAVRRPGRCPDPGERHPRIERDHAGAAATRVGNALPRRARASSDSATDATGEADGEG
jgi:hypothetical protein